MRNAFRNYHFQNNQGFTTTSSHSCGFTLVELLIVIAISAFVGVITVIILVTSLRISTKTTIINNVRENGNYALTQMVTSVRYASNVACSSTPPAITVTALDDSQTVYQCIGATITSNGTSIIDINSVSLVSGSCSFTCTQQTPTATPIVQISFSLQQSNSASFVEQSAAPLQFSTSVIMRNGNR